MDPHRSSSSLALVMLLLLGSLLMVSAAAVGQGDPTVVSVELDQQSLLLDISTGQPAVASFSGSVDVSEGAPSVVQLEAVVEGQDWDTTIDPSSYATSGNDTKEFRGTVRVPPTITAAEYTLRVSAKSNEPGFFPPEGFEKLTLRVITDRIVVELPEAVTLQAANVSTAHEIELTLRNIGATADTFLLSADGTALPQQGPPWAVAPLQEQLDLEPDTPVTAVVALQVPPLVGEGAVELLVPITVLSEQTGQEWSGELSVTVLRAPPAVTPAPPPDAPAWVAYLPLIGLMAPVAVAMIFFGGTEIGFLWLLSALLPLYARLRKERVLDNFSRGQIFGYVRANPGCHYSEIQHHLEVGNGVLAHHLKVLEREGYIHASRDGLYKRFYPANAKPVRRKHLTRIQRDILLAIGDDPGTTQMRIAKQLGESKQVVHYHIKQLGKAGLVASERDGNVRRLRLTAKAERDYGRASLLDEGDEVVPAEPVLE